jgi:quercetin dioxygenase-like cupin family protein
MPRAALSSVQAFAERRRDLSQTAHESGGEVTLVEVELAPGGGNGLHYHRSYTERFSPIVGELGVQIGKERRRGLDAALLARYTPHATA